MAGKALNSLDGPGVKDPEDKPKATSRLAIKDAGKTVWVEQADIEWIDAAGDYMCVHVVGPGHNHRITCHIMRKTMKQLEKELDPGILQRVHRSTMVNTHRVQQLRPHINGEYFLTLKSGHTIKLSRTYKSKLKFFSRSLIATQGGSE